MKRKKKEEQSILSEMVGSAYSFLFDILTVKLRRRFI